jgi:phosphoserine phosphatase
MLIIFDVEGVLLNAEYLPVLAQVMGPRKEKEIWDITNAGINSKKFVEKLNILTGICFA